jgi:hypothetical protein
MTSHVGRLYALAASILGLFRAWAGVAAAPWPAKAAPAAEKPGGQAALLAAYEQRLHRDSRLVRRLLARRAEQAPAPAPQVRIVTAPPVATTKSS